MLNRANRRGKHHALPARTTTNHNIIIGSRKLVSTRPQLAGASMKTVGHFWFEMRSWRARDDAGQPGQSILEKVVGHRHYGRWPQSTKNTGANGRRRAERGPSIGVMRPHARLHREWRSLKVALVDALNLSQHCTLIVRPNSLRNYVHPAVCLPRLPGGRKLSYCRTKTFSNRLNENRPCQIMETADWLQKTPVGN